MKMLTGRHCVRNRDYLLTLLMLGISSNLVRESLAAVNLDVSEPIIRKSPATDQDSFGYAVVLHHIVEPEPGNFDSFIDNTRIIVGAPHGTYPGGVPGLPTLMPENGTGLVYQCPLRNGNCTGVMGNDRLNDRRLFDGDPNVYLEDNVTENKSVQLMGSVLSSNGDFFIACAPRWVVIPLLTLNIDNSRPVGRCFISPRNLTGFKLIRPCAGDFSLNPVSTVNSDGQCLSGFSTVIIDKGNKEAVIAVGALGDDSFKGNLFSYNVTEDSVSGKARTLAVPGLAGYLYEGYSTITGFITSNKTVEGSLPDVITGVPRYDGATLTGTVKIRRATALTGNNFVFYGNVTGSQAGEYFGYSMAAADLNFDGYDELIVGAPIYSDGSRTEAGIVYVYENIQGELNATAITLSGSTRLSRFGTSVVSLGDINGDNFEDIAVGAPYEYHNVNSSGTVYIYYGRSSAMGLISRAPDQTIQSYEIIENVPGLIELNGFGFSIFSGVDVDGNQFNDLLVGAYESKIAVLMRSLSVAFVTVNVTTILDEVMFDTTGTNGSYFDIQVCASFVGRGLEGRSLNTTLVVTEIPSSGVSRLLMADNLTRSFRFPENGSHCSIVSVFVKPFHSITSRRLVDLREPLQVRVSFLPLTRPMGNSDNLIDFRDYPILIVDGIDTASIQPTVNCSRMNGREVCHPDLTITLESITYKNSAGETLNEPFFVANQSATIHLNLRYDNIGEEPAFKSQIEFTVPSILTFSRVEEDRVSCTTAESIVTCTLPNIILPQGSGAFTLVLRPMVSNGIRGDEPNVSISITIQTISERDMETNINNNELINGPALIDFIAISDLSVTLMFTENPVTYGDSPVPNNPTVDDIGQRVSLSLTTVNRGPTTAPNAVLDIFLPTNAGMNKYYLYLINITFDDSNSIECDMTLFNPQRLPGTMDNVRRKRSSLYSRQMPNNTTSNPIPFDDPKAMKRNCTDPVERMEYCSKITCTISDFFPPSQHIFNIRAALDERTFQSETSPFIFEGYATIRPVDDFVRDNNATNNQASTNPYRVITFVEPEEEELPIWIFIVCAIVAILLIILLFVVLYFFGFFRRKKMEAKKEAEEDLNDAQPDPHKDFTESGKLDSDGEAALGDEDKELDPEPPTMNNIEDAADLEDGGVEKPKDPDETSL